MAESSTTNSPTSWEPRLLNVKTNIEAIKASDPVSPDTFASAETLLAKANDPSVDIELLEVGARSLDKAQARKLQVMELDEINFFFDIGDWAATIVECLRGKESILQKTFNQTYGKELKESGMSPSDAQKQVQRSQNWRGFVGSQMEESYTNIEAEVNEITKWMARGSDDGVAPRTQVLDRLKKLCDEIPMSYPLIPGRPSRPHPWSP